MPTISAAVEGRLNEPGNIPQSPAAGNPVSIAHASVPSIHSRHRILVIDDNIINCQVAAQIMKAAGCDADTSIDSYQALELHRQRSYDLILMDCQMPELDGYQATQRIRAEEAGSRRTVIIGWTSTHDSGAREKCMDAGMDDLMMKPIGASTARAMVTRWLTSAAPIPSPCADTATNWRSDLARTQQLFGPRFAELADLYLSDTPPRIAALRNAIEEHDIVTIVVICHVLSGSSYSIGATHVAEACRELEACCKAAFSGTCNMHLEKIEGEYREFASKLQDCCSADTLMPSKKI